VTFHDSFINLQAHTSKTLSQVKHSFTSQILSSCKNMVQSHHTRYIKCPTLNLKNHISIWKLLTRFLFIVPWMIYGTFRSKSSCPFQILSFSNHKWTIDKGVLKVSTNQGTLNEGKDQYSWPPHSRFLIQIGQTVFNLKARYLNELVQGGQLHTAFPSLRLPWYTKTG
jgi:hypothetical protein